jgi:hypothetical protein
VSCENDINGKDKRTNKNTLINILGFVFPNNYESILIKY